MSKLFLTFLLSIVILGGCVTEQTPTKTVEKPKLFELSKAYTVSSKLPLQKDRPDNLKVSIIPAGIRYHMADDAIVCEYAAKLDTLIKNGPTTEAGDLLLVQTGFASLSQDVAKSMKLIHATSVQKGLSGQGPAQLKMYMTMKAPDAAAFIQFFTDTVRGEGPWTIRTMNSAEMNKWWYYIAFDIDEPTFIVETAGGKYKFVVAYSNGNGSVISIDELNSLPDVADGCMINTPENVNRLSRCKE